MKGVRSATIGIKSRHVGIVAWDDANRVNFFCPLITDQRMSIGTLTLRHNHRRMHVIYSYVTTWVMADCLSKRFEPYAECIWIVSIHFQSEGRGRFIRTVDKRSCFLRWSTKMVVLLHPDHVFLYSLQLYECG